MRLTRRRFFALSTGTAMLALGGLKSIPAFAGTDDTQKVMAQMKATPIHDFFTKEGHIREDGRMVHEMHLFEVKKPEESKGDWDLYKLLATVPGDESFRPLEKGGCPLVKTA